VAHINGPVRRRVNDSQVNDSKDEPDAEAARGATRRGGWLVLNGAATPARAGAAGRASHGSHAGRDIRDIWAGIGRRWWT
jgi:hypothetical protein